MVYECLHCQLGPKVGHVENSRKETDESKITWNEIDQGLRERTTSWGNSKTRGPLATQDRNKRVYMVNYVRVAHGKLNAISQEGSTFHMSAKRQSRESPADNLKDCVPYKFGMTSRII